MNIAHYSINTGVVITRERENWLRVCQAWIETDGLPIQVANPSNTSFLSFSPRYHPRVCCEIAFAEFIGFDLRECSTRKLIATCAVSHNSSDSGQRDWECIESAVCETIRREDRVFCPPLTKPDTSPWIATMIVPSCPASQEEALVLEKKLVSWGVQLLKDLESC